MIFALGNKWSWLRQACHPQWWTGPIFGKELRVASRQRKYYWLRLAYVCLLVAVIFHFWHMIVQIGGGGSGVGQVARLGATGVRVIVTIVWFQFLTAQVLAIVLLSDAISSEVRQRTLEGLLLTPTGAVQIVLGKLFGRLLHVVLFLAISVPVLGVARAFGGVPWDYVVSGLCITFCVTLLAGSLSLYYSIRYRQAHLALWKVAYWYVILCGGDILNLLRWARSAGAHTPLSGLSLISPFSALLARTQVVLTGPTAGWTPAPLAWHCLLILTVAVIVLVSAVRQVRGIARDPTLGLEGGALPHPTAPPLDPWQAMKRVWAERMTQRVQGPPVVWKELRAPLFWTRSQMWLHLGLWVAIGGPIVALIILADPNLRGFLSEVAWVLQWVLFIRLGVVATGAVTREKEAGTWAVLLATPLEDSEIVQGKALAALRRNLALLMPLLVIYGVMSLLRPPGEHAGSPWVPWRAAPLVHLIGTTLFLTGRGFVYGPAMQDNRHGRSVAVRYLSRPALIGGPVASGRVQRPAPGEWW